MRKILETNKVENSALKSMADFHNNVVTEVEAAIKDHNVVVVGMKTNPVVAKAKKMLDEKNISFHYIEHGSYLSKWKERLAIKLWSGWPTFPQVFHKGVLIGGASDLKKYIEADKLS